MDREEIARELQALVGRCMSLETAARELGETSAAEDLKQARGFLVAAGQRLEPPPEPREFLVAVG
jgi:hypothetical protein